MLHAILGFQLMQLIKVVGYYQPQNGLNILTW